MGAQAGHLSFRILDPGCRCETAARVEIRDQSGKNFVPPSSVPVIRNCPSSPVPDWFPGLFSGFSTEKYIDNPYTGTRQFYTEGVSEVDLPAGRYALFISKGIEFRPAERVFEIKSGLPTILSVTLDRWIDPALKGWVGSDDHVHVPRLSAKDNRLVSRWMQAEDIRVANLLQIGNAHHFHGTPQYAFGEDGVYKEGNYLLVSGQEHPRTHVFGHAIALGADRPIDPGQRYVIFSEFIEQVTKAGGLVGIAHWGVGSANDGLAVHAPSRKITFIEVLQMDYAQYGVWYELLNLGIRIAPTGGSDFPCGPSALPGRERFYTRIEGPLNRKNWLKGVERGRTFVTNGPLVDFFVENTGIGDELVIQKSRHVKLRATVRFDPKMDQVGTKEVELIKNGVPIPAHVQSKGDGTLELQSVDSPTFSSWYAIRVAGKKVGETPLKEWGYEQWQYDFASNISSGISLTQREAHARTHATLTSDAHTAAIYVTLPGTAQALLTQRRLLAQKWLDRLNSIEQRFSPKAVGKIAIWDWVPNSDGVPTDILQSNAGAVLEEVRRAKQFFSELLNNGASR